MGTVVSHLPRAVWRQAYHRARHTLGAETRATVNPIIIGRTQSAPINPREEPGQAITHTTGERNVDMAVHMYAVLNGMNLGHDSPARCRTHTT